MSKEIYATTFCNMGHNTKTGKPVGHECYILDPKSIAAERNGDFSIAPVKEPRKMCKGK